MVLTTNWPGQQDEKGHETPFFPASKFDSSVQREVPHLKAISRAEFNEKAAAKNELVTRWFTTDYLRKLLTEAGCQQFGESFSFVYFAKDAVEHNQDFHHSIKSFVEEGAREGFFQATLEERLASPLLQGMVCVKP